MTKVACFGHFEERSQEFGIQINKRLKILIETSKKHHFTPI